MKVKVDGRLYGLRFRTTNKEYSVVLMGNQQGQAGPSNKSKQTREDEPFGRETILLKQAFQKWISGGDGHLSQTEFQEKLFPLQPAYGQLLFDYFIKECSDDEVLGLTESKYVEGGLKLYQTGSVPPVETYFQIFSGSNDTLKKEDAQKMFFVCLQLSWSCSQLDIHTDEDDPALVALVNSLFGRSEEISVSNFTSSYGRNCRQMFSGLHQITTRKLVGWTEAMDRGQVGDGAAAPASEVVQHIGDGKGLLNAATLWALSTSLPVSYIPTGESEALLDGPSFESALMDIISPSGWHMLYNSNTHGLSVRSFQHSVLEYKGPTVILISFKDHLYCLATDTEWREGRSRFGSSDCCLIQILPKYTLMQSGADMLYLNFTDARSPRGLHVGKDPRTTFLTIDEDFSKVMHYGIPCDLYNLEVWGCGGSDVKDAQKKQREWENKQVQKSKDRKIKLDDWKDSPDRQILELGGVTTEHAER